MAITLRTSARAFPRVWGNFPDSRKALGILANEAGDNVLLSDLVAAEGCCFQSIRSLEDGDHFNFCSLL